MSPQNTNRFWALGAIVAIALVVIVLASQKNERRRAAVGARESVPLQRLRESLARMKNLNQLPTAIDSLKRLLQQPQLGTKTPSLLLAPTKPSSAIDLARRECQLLRCAQALERLAAEKPRTPEIDRTLRNLLPRALEQTSTAGPGDAFDGMLRLARGLGAHELADRFEVKVYRDLCARLHRCVDAALEIARRVTASSSPMSDLLRETLPRALAEAEAKRRFTSGRRLLDAASRAGVEVDAASWERRLRKAALRGLFFFRDAFLQPSIYSDAAQHAWRPPSYREPGSLVRGHDGRAWRRVPQRTGAEVYVLDSALDLGKYRSRVGDPGFFDAIDILRSSPLELVDLWPFWKRLLRDTLGLPLLLFALYLLLTLVVSPRFTAKLLRHLRLWRVARWCALWACARRRHAAPKVLAGPAIDLARIVDLCVRRRMTSKKREHFLAQAERYLESAAPLHPGARAWLARILFLRAQIARSHGLEDPKARPAGSPESVYHTLLDEARRAAESSFADKPSAFVRIERARIAIAEGKVAAAASHLHALPWWRTLTRDAMWLRAIVAFHAGKMVHAKRWLFFVRTNRALRRQSQTLAALLCEHAGNTLAAERCAERAAKPGESVASAALWLARQARHRGDAQTAKRWAEEALGDHPKSVSLRVELELARGNAAGLCALARENPGSREVLVAAYRVSAEQGHIDSLLDARLEEGEEESSRNGAALRRAKGDYALARGDAERAVELWADASRSAPDETTRARATILARESLQRNEPERALRIARRGGVSAELQSEAEARALFARLDRARRGLPFRSTHATKGGPPVARALDHLHAGDGAAAKAALAEDTTLDAGERERIRGWLSKERTTTADEVASLGPAGAEILSQRMSSLHEALNALRTATQRHDAAAARAAFDRLRPGIRATAPEPCLIAVQVIDATLSLCFQKSSSDPMDFADSERALAPHGSDLRAGRELGLAAQSDPGRAPALEALAAHHPDPYVRAAAERDLALTLAPAVDTPHLLPARRVRLFVEAWDRAYSSSATRAYLQQRALELDEAHLDADAIDRVLERTTAHAAAWVRPFLEAKITNHEAVPLWVHESAVAEHAAQALVEDRTRDAEAALARAETNRRDTRLAAQTWREEGQALLRASTDVALLSVAEERAQALKERVSSALINLSVDANAATDYDVAIDATRAAAKLTRSPDFQRICRNNLTAYEMNRAGAARG